MYSSLKILVFTEFLCLSCIGEVSKFFSRYRLKQSQLECTANNDFLTSTVKSQIDSLVAERTEHRLRRCYEAADQILTQLKLEYNVEVIDIPYKLGGQSTWRHIPPPLAPMSINRISVTGDNVTEVEDNLMLMAHNAYVQLKSGEISEASIVEKCLYLLHCAEYKKFMNPSIISEMQGRKFADAAFDFSLAGVTSTELYDLLLSGAMAEMVRYGHRKSCRAVDILQVVERLAVAGVVNQNFFRLAAEKLQYKVMNQELHESASFSAAIDRLSSGSFNLFSDMPLLWLWRFSARQRKSGNQLSDDTNSNDFENTSQKPIETDAISSAEAKDCISDIKKNPVILPVFDDPSLPLIIDIGCGFGVSILGLSHREKNLFTKSIDHEEPSYTVIDPSTSTTFSRSSTRRHNFFACDMSHRAISYATSISKRWDMHGNCKFIESDAVDFLDLIIREYQGPVECVLINFPTPYRFGIENPSSQSNITSGVDRNNIYEISDIPAGNSQLPNLSDFMVSPLVIELSRQTLNKKQTFKRIQSNRLHDDHMTAYSEKYIIIQSNVEDVAVTMQNIVKESPQYNEPGGFYMPTDCLQLTQISKNWNYSSDKDLSFLTDSHAEMALDTSCQDLDKEDNLNVFIDIDESSSDSSATSDNAQESKLLQKRAEKWILSGGARARGPGWLSASPLPSVARTETEAMCEHYGKAVHRTLFFLKESI